MIGIEQEWLSWVFRLVQGLNASSDRELGCIVRELRALSARRLFNFRI